MGKLRHIALSVPDPWETAEFYMKAFGMTKVGETDSSIARGVYLSDGTINLALLNYKSADAAGRHGTDFVGVHHIGFWVDDIQGAQEQVKKAGAKYFMGEVPDAAHTNNYYEVKYHDPDGIIFDLTATGWGGASKDGTAQTQGPKPAVPDLVADRSEIEAKKKQRAA